MPRNWGRWDTSCARWSGPAKCAIEVSVVILAETVRPNHDSIWRLESDTATVSKTVRYFSGDYSSVSGTITRGSTGWFIELSGEYWAARVCAAVEARGYGLSIPSADGSPPAQCVRSLVYGAMQTT